ncbi:MAG: thiamine-phosphate kinase [Gemmatimonadales bacterium]
MTVPPLGPGAEFDVIRNVLRDAVAPGAMVALGAGDDCALLRTDGGYYAVTVDLFVEGVHFRSAWGSPEEVGGRAVRAAISDLAAMAADPVGVLVSLSLPAGQGAELAGLIGHGCRAAAEALDAALIGGDLSRGGSQLTLDVAAVGSVREPQLRSGARPGDEIWVSGALGGAAAAVAAWKSESPVREKWRERFWRPTPRLREARWLAERGAVAAIDLSDGLLADAGHVAAASGVGIEIDWAAIPAAPGVDTELALGGGEDYELLVAVPRGILSDEDIAEFNQAFAIPLTRVGRAVSGTGVRVFRDGAEVEVASRGFDHLM